VANVPPARTPSSKILATSGQSSCRSSRTRIDTATSMRPVSGTVPERGLSLQRLRTSSAVVVEGELGRMRPQPHDVDLVFPLVIDPGADQLLAEDAAREQELVVGFKCRERLGERAGHLRDAAV